LQFKNMWFFLIEIDWQVFRIFIFSPGVFLLQISLRSFRIGPPSHEMVK
jgi:hypothetical protein